MYTVLLKLDTHTDSETVPGFLRKDRKYGYTLEVGISPGPEWRLSVVQCFPPLRVREWEREDGIPSGIHDHVPSPVVRPSPPTSPTHLLSRPFWEGSGLRRPVSWVRDVPGPTKDLRWVNFPFEDSLPRRDTGSGVPRRRRDRDGTLLFYQNYGLGRDSGLHSCLTKGRNSDVRVLPGTCGPDRKSCTDGRRDFLG